MRRPRLFKYTPHCRISSKNLLDFQHQTRHSLFIAIHYGKAAAISEIVAVRDRCGIRAELVADVDLAVTVFVHISRFAQLLQLVHRPFPIQNEGIQLRGIADQIRVQLLVEEGRRRHAQRIQTNIAHEIKPLLVTDL